MSRTTSTGGRAASQGVIPGRFALSVGLSNLPTPEGFAWTKLTSVARLESGHTPSRRAGEYWDGDIPWVGIRDATANHGRVINDTAQHITQAGLDNSSARLLPAGTVCLSRTASVGYVVTMGVPMATSQDFVNWVCGPNLNCRYLHYVLQSEQESVRRFAHGTTHQTMYYPEAKALHVLLPSRSKQDSVAAMLGALDDKIAANDRLIETADAWVRAKYQALERASAERRPLAELASNARDQVDPGKVESDSPYVGLEHVRRRRMWLSEWGQAGDVSSGKTRFATGDTLFGKLRPYFHKVSVAPVDGICSTDILVIRALDVDAGGLVLAACASDEAISLATAGSEGTRMPRASWRDLATLEVPWGGMAPRRFSGEVAQIAMLAGSVTAESQKLAHTRDTLLPLLMSGKVTVKDAEKQVEEVV